MEPNLPSPQQSPEMGPPRPASPETPAPMAPEVQQHSPERPAPQEQRTGSGAGDTPPPVPMPVIPLPSAPAAAPPATTTDPQGNNPITAADDDLIEKEWVERAKKVIAETRHDPYEQEKAVSRLQADYLNKRYGKDIKLHDER